MRNALLSSLLVIVSIVVALVIAELAAQFYVNNIAGKPKLFQSDTLLGWRPIPNLDITRTNANGEPWRIKTDSAGWRPPPNAKDNNRTGDQESRQVVLLGDSYVFGQGVDVDDRFDAVMVRRMPDLHAVNMGVMGYGTDQQLLVLEQVKDDLRQGDKVVMVTYFNDLFDLLRRNFTGRSKPWFKLNSNDSLILNKPEIGFSGWLRNHSYIYTRLALLNEHRRSFPRDDLEYAVRLYSELVQQYLTPLAERDIEVVIAYHGFKQFPRPKVQKLLEQEIVNWDKEKNFSSIKLDSVLDMDRHLLRDGHWNPDGHHSVGEALLSTFE